MTDNDQVTAKVLARRLGLTPRRISQLIEEHILPAARLGRYHAVESERRYCLYRNKRDAIGWADFYAATEAAAVEAERLLEAALSPTATLDCIRRASCELRELTARLTFLAVCRSSSAAERNFLIGLWEEREKWGLRLLVERADEIVAREDASCAELVRESAAPAN